MESLFPCHQPLPSRVTAPPNFCPLSRRLDDTLHQQGTNHANCLDDFSSISLWNTSRVHRCLIERAAV